MNKQSINIAQIRREYTHKRLRRADLTLEPMELFERWFRQASTAQLLDLTVVSVATVDQTGQPYQRLVLLKHFDAKGMVFYTNLGSRKAQHLAHNARISLHFPWHALERQVMVLGTAKQLALKEVMHYFSSRPRNSQISAWASSQSSLIDTRDTLVSTFLKFNNYFHQGKVPLPSFWGGYRVHIDSMEFWQGGAYRLHDRFIYQRIASGWRIDRLAP
ncbi:pyridoxamine 5'-phosphate oxidase [Candidatus Palibaumannia cicadellinicola]|uniref:Pyridoxine/pyridoxamine 5'-phosphate oxidase n=1 Tax=Baumannia cicadellinicola subsp. Homalodisca coagulata TaxID=374463 RepID=PDXH_BAUCH|nr:pyridoxamine 5'-phosphate oxidase [Candidatus Baumannia cicadellinicola]Q1LU04.1 RecName: Full=Pyridoxine/pyridoxamine 5'-phosphate oxidase; AltName: Full=PNP/PMP oxidase; Short=PNPOx; AltName: Full=Pyridoxal 5'-phosphate synthase [Baumannia cicadellinicola str. Hc (Homalodisca coagulata)]ABF14338.1 pyridoxamine 5'-phosphate oxidase [Baumannia cicadellinicola str. Hc (Homalodisca coagulata)]MBS0032617.1 pyridoxamine 5'-phosphate oxidase [Candidatus Baumannia cicadellinicola]MCJ7462458.1 pyri